MTILDQSELDAAAAHLAETAHLRRWLTEDRDADAAPHKAALEAVREGYRTTLEDLAITEETLRGEILDYVSAVEAIRAEMIAAGEVPIEPAALPGGLALRRVGGLAYDLTALPREYLAPDEKKIKAALKEGKEIPGVTPVERDTLVVAAKNRSAND